MANEKDKKRHMAERKKEVRFGLQGLPPLPGSVMAGDLPKCKKPKPKHCKDGTLGKNSISASGNNRIFISASCIIFTA